MSRPTLVITGASGFVGPHVAVAAVAAGYRVVAVGREESAPSVLAGVCADYISVDLTQEWPRIEDVDAVVHLAGLAAVGPSFAHPQRYIEVNSAITTRMAESLLASNPSCRVVIVSSGSVYDAAATAGAITEDSPLSPTSPYAVAKILVETQARYYSNRGLDVVVARPFNHIGPGQGAGFIVPDIASALRELKDGEALPVGDLSTARDYSDVRDVAQAYVTLASSPDHAHLVYNVASGASRSGHEVLTEVAAALEVSLPRTVVDPRRLRPGDTRSITGDARRLRDEFGWAPLIPWETSVKDYVGGLNSAS